MRSITLKLVLGFISVSLLSVLLIVIFVRVTTEREFRDFTFDSSRNNILTALEDFYQSQGSWDGIAFARFIMREPIPANNPMHRDPMTIVDENGYVVRAGMDYQIGQLIPTYELKNGTPIVVDGETVGYLIFARQPFGPDSLETAFLNRINLLLIYIAVGTILVALLIGTLLSRTLTRPIRELKAATHAITEGNFSLEVPVRSRDEMGELAESFNLMSKELAHSLHLRRQMTADIAHELRTPLSLILGHAEAVHDGVIAPSAENFEIIREEATRLDHLIDDLRTLSLADAGELAFVLQPVLPTKLLNDIASTYQMRAHQKEINLELNAGSGLPEILVDPGRMTQVLTNILDNALRHTPAGGKITLSAGQEGDWVKLSVQDSGPGLAGEAPNRIFDRFYRTDDSRNRNEGGSGLGLAIAKSIVETHHGKIFAASQSGEGLSITILLPINLTSEHSPASIP